VRSKGSALPEDIIPRSDVSATPQGVADHMKRGTVLLADRHSPMLEGLRVLLEGYFDAVIMVADESSLYRAVERLQPECAVVDLSFPHLERANDNIISVLRERVPGLAIIALSVHDEPVVAERTLELGADGFVVKGAAVRDLLPAIDAVLRGEKYVSSCVHP
jgi:DNA-binding NarL/FixJ family response regulator